ncbi:hypothetical protein TorRG33x02_006540 [Trema orientale]|uniref:Uncharacterized protein n=1 Tax=Trema orientale TaxID=63057 RepID=A0A2P5G0B6_TREOI|nr:hypothetical protein TorRG33x02_006540 [Trema orientale]
MGTKVEYKSYLPGYCSMRDLNEDSNSCSWPLYYNDKILTNGQYYNGFRSRFAAEAYPGYDKDAVKRTMLEHEAIFKDQVYELHRLYRTQRDLMDEIKRKELHRNGIPIETSLSSSPLASQITSEDARKWHNHSFPMVNSMCARPSILGVEGIHSPLSYMKGNCTQTGPLPSQSGCSSKDIEVLESRPTKVRRKMFDLQLPADEYIDTEEGEQLSDDKVSAISSSYPNRNCQIAPESGVKFFLDDNGKNDCKSNALKSDTCLRSTNGLADLNEPIELEEIKETHSTSYYFYNGKIQDSGRSTKPNSNLLGLPKEISVNSYGSDGGTKNNLHSLKNGNGSGCFPHVLEAGQRNSNLHSVPQTVQTEKLPQSSQPTQVSPNKVHEPVFYLSDKSKVNLWREKTACGVEIPERSSDFTNNRQLRSFATSRVPGPYEIPPPDLGKPWSHPWEKSNGSFSQKSVSVQTYAGLNSIPTMSKSSQASVQSDGIFGDRWYLDSNLRSNQAFGSELPYRNGFYQGSSSGSKELPIRIPSISGDYLSCSNEHNKAPVHLTHDGLAKCYKGSNCMDMKPTKDMNLNVVISDCSSNEETPSRGVEILGTEQKHDQLAVIPWLGAKLACKNEASDFVALSKTGEMNVFQSFQNQLSCKNEIAKDCNQLFAQNVSFSSATDVQVRKTEPSDCPSNRKLLGFPIFEKPHISKNELSSLTSPSVSLQKPSESKVVNNWNRVLDINLPCDSAAPDLVEQDEAEILVVEKETDAKSGCFRHHIDLNSCLTDDEASLKPSAPTTTVKFTAEIDLEAPVPEAEDDFIPGDAPGLKQNEALVPSSKEVAVQQDELIMVAAEAIVAISLSVCPNQLCEPCNLSETPLKESNLIDPLIWFVEIVSSYGDDLEGKFDTALRVRDGEDNEEDSSEGIDYFESMILNLTETKEEDYMPEPLVPKNLNLEETGTSLLSNRPRKGQARRGRQRRDFQRDILPGLASLSRHEVTEDLQTFGGLMRAMGHSWHSGLTRRNSTRNGSGRGRRRSAVSPSPPAATTPPCTPLVQQLNNIEMGLEDRSLTGWGKTTRRPRRQRCPAGNPPSIPLT